jgi:hypothetical protein
MIRPKSAGYRIFPVLVILIISVILLLPLFKAGFPVTDDGTWMIIRLSAFYQSLREGQFPVRFLGRLNNGYGYPVANFLYPGFLYIGSLLKFSGFSFVDSVKIIMAFSMAGTALCLYVWLNRQFSKAAAVISVLGFIASPYILFDLYTRGSVGEILAMFFCALVLVLLSRKNPAGAALSFGCLVISHNTVALIFTVCLMLFILIRKRWDYLWVLFGGLGLSAFFWIPALAEKQYVSFDSIKVSDPRQYFINGKYIFLVPAMFCISFIIGWIVRKQKRNGREFGYVFLVFAGSLFMSLPLSDFLWSNKILSQTVQFPFRLLTITVFSGAWITAYAYDNLSGKFRNSVFAVLCTFVLLQAFPILNRVESRIYEDGYYSTNEGTTTVSSEYMPKWAGKSPGSKPSQKISVISGSANILPRIITTQKIDADIDATIQSVIQINTVYYPGWGVTLGNELQPIKYGNQYGFIQIDVPPGKFRLYSEFRETWFRFAADLVSFGTLIIITVIYCMKIMKRKET